MTDDLTLRAETPGDETAIRAVTTAAFGKPEEADLVEALRRDPAWIPALSRVAVTGGRVVAHALLTRCHVGETPALALGPVAVAPEVQRQGLGTLVVEDALREARERGGSAVAVLGHPAYYPRFGFTTASRHGIGVAFDVPDEALMAMSLDGEPLPSGTIRYAPPFGV
ncbi:N-acetyltransferase [Nonomuraea sp. KC401]|uniref:GNAT family N-acetyltransferase n=1 Tax=unclassified Nonomuraea TaxID=2593643 RepID=UPI0010FE1DE2|nr:MULTISPECIES: N-acetyltransferase [unclassified Nonomuraea]NBE99123.1 GNAT family N-acetyltransferase [Nonomuraea sp. K271]TLF58179.1 N-acetyltransferase [Nonomuraea sp. KC401]